MANRQIVTSYEDSEIRSLIIDCVSSCLKHHFSISNQRMDSDQWFDLNQVVKYDPENRTKATWYALVAKGEVPYYKKSKKLAFLKSEIDEFLKSGRRKSASESRNAPEEFLKQPKSRKG